MDPKARENREIPKWTVWRQDDNGRRYIVDHHAEQAVAVAQAAEMEARGHKQIYWVERSTSA